MQVAPVGISLLHPPIGLEPVNLSPTVCSSRPLRRQIRNFLHDIRMCGQQSATALIISANTRQRPGQVLCCDGGTRYRSMVPLKQIWGYPRGSPS